ncbi:MAG TPA: hypothetical protein VGR43_02335, partial [Dehalococcoidia bacterium]|nr:hypothetical protein [Dehalococcoidia bacterium]
PSTFVDHEYGYSINAPKFAPAKSGATVARVFICAPAEDGFASNVNVLIQPKAVSRAAYREETLQGFKTLAHKVKAERNATVGGREALFVDAEGEQQGREMRFLSLAVFDTDRVILTTCSAPKASFAKYEAAFRATLDSFKLLPGATTP